MEVANTDDKNPLTEKQREILRTYATCSRKYAEQLIKVSVAYQRLANSGPTEDDFMERDSVIICEENMLPVIEKEWEKARDAMND